MTDSSRATPVGEFGLIHRISSLVGAPRPPVSLGIGDDTAIISQRDGSSLLLSSDAFVEGVHFDLSYMSPPDVGHKALAAALSDIAAMNGQPIAALISLALPVSVAQSSSGASFLDGFYEGAQTLARECGVQIVGGDLTRSLQGIFIDVSCLGQTTQPIRRSGARPGDWVAVSGQPGSSAAGLFVLQNKLDAHSMNSLKLAHTRPRPRFDLLAELSPMPAPESQQSLCTSLIDLSDGLASELHHLANQSGVGFEIDASRLPLNPSAIELARNTAQDALEWCLSGGEDYELLATLDPIKVEERGGPPAGFSIIGRATVSKSVVTLTTPSGQPRLIAPTGFNHFSSASNRPTD